jgi:hypothetical protein
MFYKQLNTRNAPLISWRIMNNKTQARFKMINSSLLTHQNYNILRYLLKLGTFLQFTIHTGKLVTTYTL